MEVELVEDSKYFGICKCCLRDGCFRSMWAEYEVDGVVQNYGKMLNECFDLCWQQPDNSLLEQICDACVSHTRNAYTFHRLILKSQDRLNGVVQLDGESNTEVQDKKPIYAEDISDVYMTVTVKVEAPEADSEDLHHSESETLQHKEDPKPGVFEQVEYLELENEEQENTEEPTSESTPNIRPKKRTRRPRAKGLGYRQYTPEDLERAMAAVRNKILTVTEAAAANKIPRNTLAFKIVCEKRGELPLPAPSGRYAKFIEEIQTLLTYTNMIPYKSKSTHLHCAYCSTGAPFFPDPDELRKHTITQHAGDRTKGVERFLRPLWLAEILKVDIENLHCTVCCICMTSWNGMFQHLNEEHDLEFDEAYTRIIPFNLSNNWRCSLCKESFPNYHHLNTHMNAHYDNHMCSECGEPYLSEARLRKHLQIHDTGRFQCEECSKTFRLEKYRRKHIEFVHKQKRNIKCLYCSEKFHAVYPRHLHVLAHHKEKVKIITCEPCGKTFDWRPYYLAHKKRNHKN